MIFPEAEGIDNQTLDFYFVLIAFFLSFFFGSFFYISLYSMYLKHNKVKENSDVDFYIFLLSIKFLLLI